MATVLLLRHGRTASNAAGSLAGRTSVDLDEVGLTQAKAMAERLAGIPLAAVISSPLSRCLQTLSLALPTVTPTIEPDLIECGYGEWEGQQLRKLAKDPLWRVVQQHPSAVTFPGGESMAAMAARAIAAVRNHDSRVAREHGDAAIWLACTHGDLIKAIVADALGLHLDQFQRIVADPGSVTVIRYTPVRPFVVRLNDTGGALGALLPPPRTRRRRLASASRPERSDPASRAERAAPGASSSDAPVGGGAGRV
jgi:probable phosphomutase (TIGR03848 family)